MDVLKKLLITLGITAFFVYMAYILIDQQGILNGLNEDKVRLTREIQEEDFEAEKLNDRWASISTNEYIAEVAKEQCGLVYEEDIIFSIFGR